VVLIDDISACLYDLNGYMCGNLSLRGRQTARAVVAWLMIFLFPLSLMAGDTPAAVLHSKGGVWVNGSDAVDSTSIFPGDLLETKPGFFANLDSEGSSILIQPESILKFQSNFVDLEHGNISVGTSSSTAVHVNCYEIDPVNPGRTEYDVKDTNGTIEIAARKGELNIRVAGNLQKASKGSASSRSGIVHEGQQEIRKESDCGEGPKPPGAGHAFPAKWVEIGAAAGGAIALCLVFCKSSSPSSISPADP
jgi:hypothetical protein